MFVPGHMDLVSSSQHEISPRLGSESEMVVLAVKPLARLFISVEMSGKCVAMASGMRCDSARLRVDMTRPEVDMVGKSVSLERDYT